MSTLLSRVAPPRYSRCWLALLRREAIRLASRPSVEQWLERTRRRPSSIARAEVVEALDEIRGALARCWSLTRACCSRSSPTPRRPERCGKAPRRRHRPGRAASRRRRGARRDPARITGRASSTGRPLRRRSRTPASGPANDGRTARSSSAPGSCATTSVATTRSTSHSPRPLARRSSRSTGVSRVPPGSPATSRSRSGPAVRQPLPLATWDASLPVFVCNTR